MKELDELREAATLVINTWRQSGDLAVKGHKEASMNAAIRYLASTMSRGQREMAVPVEVPSGKDAVLSL